MPIKYFNLLSNGILFTTGELGISGVTRRLILQLLLESEKISVCVRGSPVLRAGPRGPTHPRHGVGHNSHLFYVSIHSTCADIIKLVSSKMISFLHNGFGIVFVILRICDVDIICYFINHTQ